MNPQKLSVAQLKEALKQRRLRTSGRKNELIVRLQSADPTGAWVQEAELIGEDTIESEEEGAEEQEAAADRREEASEGVHQSERRENDLSQREKRLEKKERELMRVEIDVLRRENELLRMSPTNNVSVESRTTVDIRNVGKLLSDYDGTGEDFPLWKTQVNLLRETYELTKSEARLMVGSKLQGKAQKWYRSRAEYLTMSLKDLMKEMEDIFDQPMGKLELRRRFEERVWRKEESFSEYWHDKIILGNRISIHEDEMVEYLVDGIPAENLRNQARMQSFPNVQEVLTAFKRISLVPEAARSSSNA